MTTKHTPGPWRLVKGVQIRSAKDQIARVWMQRNGEGTANAHLIAASPTMLEACRMARTLLRSMGVGDESHTLQTLDAAIKEAGAE